MPRWPNRPVAERFLDKVEVDLTTGCWLWTARLDRHGYGGFSADDREWLAHRFGYELLVGPIPDGLQLDHLCRVRACVNPDHLEPVTNRENVLRGESFAALNARKTHCAQGHPYDEANTYIFVGRGRTARCCRACNRAAQARRKAAAA